MSTELTNVTLAANNMAREIEQLKAELERVQRHMPPRYSATPAQVDWFLRRILTEETLLNYQRTIGDRAVEEAAKDLRMEYASREADVEWLFAADHIDPLKDGGPYPSVLLCGQHNGFGPCPGAPRCTPRDDEGGAR